MYDQHLYLREKDANPLEPNQPIAEFKERINSLDIIRGFAVFGILLVNMLGFSAPPYLLYVKLNWWTTFIDQLVMWLIFFFAVGKFYCLFSFLFGLGFSIQMLKAKDSPKFIYRYTRRLLVLLVIGLLHTFLLWWGDILHIYALLGFLLLIFANVSRKTLLITAFICFAIPLQLSFLETLVAGLNQTNQNNQVTKENQKEIQLESDKLLSGYKELTKKSIKVYSTGDYKAIFRQRIEEVKLKYSRIIFVAPQIFAMFLLGLFIGQTGVLLDIKNNLQLIRRVMKWGIGVGIVSNLVFVVSQELSNALTPSFLDILNAVSYSVGTFSLCFFYITFLIILLEDKKWQKILSPLAAIGRLALSNYLFQSIVCTTVFYSYGLAFYGKLSPATITVLAIFIYITEMTLSVWWVKRFQFGPVEWFLRSITYLRLQPNKAIKP